MSNKEGAIAGLVFGLLLVGFAIAVSFAVGELP